jgi:hypothetical protein
VCGGDNTTCCFLSFAQATVVIRDFDKVVLSDNALDAGEALLVTNLHLGHNYTSWLVKLDGSGAKAVAYYAQLLPGNSLRVVATEPGQYVLQSAERSAVSV